MIDSFIPQASSFADDIDNLILFIGVIVMAWFFLAQGIFFYFILKFRAKPGQKAVDMDGYNPMHKKWITRPHNAVLFFDIFILAFAIKVWNEVKIQMPEKVDATVELYAQRWAWTFQHTGPNGKLEPDNDPGSDDIKTAHVLHVRKGDVVKFIGISRDVLHSFSVPAFRLKQDLIPGRHNEGWFKATESGEFDIQCTEICGIGHGMMAAKIVVHEADDYAKWQASAGK